MLTEKEDPMGSIPEGWVKSAIHPNEGHGALCRTCFHRTSDGGNFPCDMYVTEVSLRRFHPGEHEAPTGGNFAERCRRWSPILRDGEEPSPQEGLLSIWQELPASGIAKFTCCACEDTAVGAVTRRRTKYYCQDPDHRKTAEVEALGV